MIRVEATEHVSTAFSTTPATVPSATPAHTARQVTGYIHCDFLVHVRLTYRLRNDTIRCDIGRLLVTEIMQGTVPGACRRGRPRTAWMDNIKTWTPRGGVSQNDRGQRYSTSSVWPTLGSRRLKNRTVTGGQSNEPDGFSGAYRHYLFVELFTKVNKYGDDRRFSLAHEKRRHIL